MQLHVQAVLQPHGLELVLRDLTGGATLHLTCELAGSLLDDLLVVGVVLVLIHAFLPLLLLLERPCFQARLTPPNRAGGSVSWGLRRECAPARRGDRSRWPRPARRRNTDRKPDAPASALAPVARRVLRR